MSDANTLLLIESRKKSGGVAALLNLFLPGAGYMYCGRWILGVAAFFIVVALAVASGVTFAIPLILLLIIDGFLSAGKYNKNLIEKVIKEQAEIEEKGSS